MVLGKQDTPMQKNKLGLLSYTTLKNYSKWISAIFVLLKRIRIKKKTHKDTPSWAQIWQWILRYEFFVTKRMSNNYNQKTGKLNFKSKPFEHQRTLSRKWKDSQQNGREYLQITYLIVQRLEYIDNSEQKDYSVLKWTENYTASTKTWKQPTCPPMDEWMKKMIHINTHDTRLHARILFSHENNETLLFAKTWMDVEGIMLSEMSVKAHITWLTYMWTPKQKVHQAHR